MNAQTRSSPVQAGADNRPRTLALPALALVVLSCGGASSLSAGPPLADPTRPPSNLRSTSLAASPAPGGSPAVRGGGDAAAASASRQAAAAATAAAAAAAAAPPPLSPLAGVLLQAVQSPARGPAVALINGQLVKVGDPVAGRLVASIDAQGVVLQGSAGSERLWLLGSSAKQAAGSIVSSRSTQFTPAQAAPEAGASGEATASADSSSTPGALSLARRTQP